MINQCPNCNSPLNGEFKFCPKCGSNMEAAAAAAAETSASAHQPEPPIEQQFVSQQQAPQQTPPQNQQQAPQQNPYQNQQGGYQQQAGPQGPQNPQGYGQPQGGQPGQNFNQTGAPYGQPQQQGKNASSKANEFLFNTPDHTAEFDPQDIAMNKNMGILSYLGFLFIIPLIAKPESKFLRFHGNQGLVLFGIELIGNFVVSLVFRVLSWIAFGPFEIIIPVLQGLIYLALAAAIIVWIVTGIMNVSKGLAKELPLIGKIKILK